MSTEKEQLEAIYNDIEACIGNIMTDPSQGNLEELGHCLDKFFTDSRCISVIYTPNTDKLFFGIYAFPKISGEDVVGILFNNNRFIVKDYWLELDSKMFTGQLMLTPAEITALIIHDVSKLVNNSKPAEIVKREIDKYLAKNNDVLKVSESAHYRGILAYGFADAMRKYTTIFEEDHYTPSGITDEFIDWVDFTGVLRSAFNKLNQMWANYNREIRNKFITLSWVMRIYKDIKHNRIPALEGIKTCILLSPSKIEQDQLKMMGARISRIDDDTLLESALDNSDQLIIKSIRESFTDRPLHTYGTIIIQEAIQDDIDRLMEKKNTENEPDGLADLLHCFNKKMACVQDYVDQDEAMTPSEFKQWDTMFRRMDKARQDLANSELYSKEKRLVNTYNKYGLQ